VGLTVSMEHTNLPARISTRE